MANEPEMPDFLKQLFASLGADTGVDDEGALLLNQVQSPLFAGRIDKGLGAKGDREGLVIGLRRDVFQAADLQAIEAARPAPPSPFGPRSGMFGFGPLSVRVHRVALRMTPEGLKPLDDGELADIGDLNDLSYADPQKPATLGDAGRMLLQGEAASVALDRATRYGLAVGSTRGIGQGRLFRDANAGLEILNLPDVKGVDPDYFARMCQCHATVAAILFDKDVVQSQTVTTGFFGRTVLPYLTENAGLGYAINSHSEPGETSFGFTWMPNWKVVATHDSEANTGISDQDMTRTRIIRNGQTVFSGKLTVESIRTVLAPLVKQEAEAFLGADCQWDQNTALLRDIVRGQGSIEQLIADTLPMPLPALPPFNPGL